MDATAADPAGRLEEEDEEFLKRCFAEALSPKLKLFLSADIVGSTQFKQPLIAQNASGEDWSRYIKQFYDRMQEGFFTYWKECLDLIDRQGSGPADLMRIYAGSRPCRWKTIGDEILFWKVLSHENQVWLTLDAWLKTIRDMREWFRAEKTGLDVKCTAWIAGFPVRNRAIVGKEREEEITGIGKLSRAMTDDDFKRAATLWSRSDYPFLKNTAIIEKFYREADWDAPVDFIGPGIDRGFRIQGFATTARMPISLDLAYLMAISVLPRGDAEKGWELNSHGLHREFVDKPSTKDFADRRGDIGNAKAARLFEGRTNLVSPAITNGLGVFYAGDALLKGVIGGAPYPNLWIDTQTPKSLDSRKEALAGANRSPIAWETLLGFCQSFFEDRADFMFAPFISDDTLETKTTMPPEDRYNFGEYLAAYQQAMIGSAPRSG